MDLIQVAIWVSELKTARSFFVDVIGLEETRSITIDGIKNVCVGGSHGEIQLRYDPDQDDPTPDRTTIDHIAISVNDVDSKISRIAEAPSCTIIEYPQTVDETNSRVAFIEGPDGYIIELVEDLG